MQKHLILEHFQHPQERPCTREPWGSTSPRPPTTSPSSLWKPLNYSLSLCLCWVIRVWGLSQQVVFGTGFFHSVSCLFLKWRPVDLFASLFICLGFPGGSDRKESACSMEDQGSIPGFRKIPWRRKWQPRPVFLPGKSHGWRSLAGYSPWGRKESDMTEWLHFHFACLFIFKIVFHWV